MGKHDGDLQAMFGNFGRVKNKPLNSSHLLRGRFLPSGLNFFRQNYNTNKKHLQPLKTKLFERWGLSVKLTVEAEFLRFLLFKIPCQNFYHREAGSFALRRGCFVPAVGRAFSFPLFLFSLLRRREVCGAILVFFVQLSL